MGTATEPETKKLKPAEGCLVRRPDTRQPLSAEGETVVMDGFWQRRLEDGDVVDVDEAEALAAREAAAAARAAAKKKEA